MIIHTGMRTDIPAFYASWLANRLREGYVLVRNPYNETAITRYALDPSVVDLICFCTKNPAPMLPYMDLLAPFRQYWFVTITPYGRDIEPHVPDKDSVIRTFRALSGIVGAEHIAWRYDPVLLDRRWTIEAHIKSFTSMARQLAGTTSTCVISFIDLYGKTQQSYPEARAVPFQDQWTLTERFVEIGRTYGLTIKPCGESGRLSATGADCSGCMTMQTYETAIGARLQAPPNPRNRKECACYLTGDIGQYDTCGHLCRYCYANTDAGRVLQNMRGHDPSSPLLIGHVTPQDVIHPAHQESWIDRQMRLDELE